MISTLLHPSMGSLALGFVVALSAFTLLAGLGLLPTPLLSLFALFVHATTGKSVFLKDRKRKFDFTEVLPGLFVGSQPRNVGDLEKLRDLGVNSIVSLNEEYELYLPSKSHFFDHSHDKEYKLRAVEKDTLLTGQGSIKRLHVPVPDYQGASPELLVKAVKFIDERLKDGDKVFVHCNGGKGRSVAVIVAYVLATQFKDEKKTERYSFREAFKMVRERRKVASKSMTHYPFTSPSRYLKAFEQLNLFKPVLEIDPLLLKAAAKAAVIESHATPEQVDRVSDLGLNRVPVPPRMMKEDSRLLKRNNHNQISL